MNYLAIIIAAVVTMIVGSLWYGPLFGKSWMSKMWMTKADMDGTDKMMYVYALINSMIMFWVLFWMIGALGDGTMMGAFSVTAMAWLGFMMTQQVSGVIWTKNPSITLVIINGLFWLVAALLGAMIYMMV